MDFLQAAIANILSLVAFGLVVAAVMKSFQIANELGEIKQVLKEIRRNSEGAPLGAQAASQAFQPAGPAQSPQNLLRALDAESYAEAIHRELGVQPPPVAPQPAPVQATAPLAQRPHPLLVQRPPAEQAGAQVQEFVLQPEVVAAAPSDSANSGVHGS